MTADQIFHKAIAAHQAGKIEEAESLYRKILKIEPTHLDVNNNLGILLYKTNRLGESEKCLKKAIELKPDFAEALNNLGNVQKGLIKLDEAKVSYQKAIDLKPGFAEAHYNLGNLLNNFGQLEIAETSLKKAIKFNPNHFDAYNNLGNIQKKLGKLSEAEKIYKKAIEIKSDYTNAYVNLASVEYMQKKFKESSKNYDHALAIKPDIDYLLGYSLFAKMYLCNWDNFSSNLLQLTKKINDKEKVATPFSLLSMIDDPSIHKKSAEIYSNDKYLKSNIFPKIPHYHRHKKIKIGYFSPDFKNHPVAYLTAELYEIHDRQKFEIHAFSFGVEIKDKINIRIRNGVDHFHDVHAMSDRDIVKLARSLEIDIAIDLAGFTKKARTSIFAMSVAPIQVSYLGYNGTMGSSYMNYVIADRIVIPDNQKQYYSEKIVYLPNSYMPNDSKIKMSEKVFIREDFGLPKDGFIFCCFNNHHKISPSTFARWMRILSKVDGSVLWLSSGSNVAIDNLRKEAKKNGIDENRLIFAERVPLMEDHLSRIKLADLFLDTLPFNAHATASDALRMGLPVLTCKGKAFAGRVAASLLNAVELPEMITTTQEQYESVAVKLANNPEKLKIIKDKLIDNLPISTLFNTPLYAQHLEAAYSKMYEGYQNKLDIEDIEIDY